LPIGRKTGTLAENTRKEIQMAHEAPLRPASDAPVDYRLVIVLVGLAQLVLTADFSILSVALPSIARNFSLKPADLSLLVSAGAVPLVGLMILSGRAADLVGQRKCMLLGLALFGVGSLCSAAAPGYGFLIGARVIQSIGAAVLMPANFSLINTLVPEGAARHKALGIFGVMQGMSLVVGLLIGGTVTSWLGWRAVFLINPPIVVAAIFLTLRCVPKWLVGTGADRSIDYAGAVLITLGTATLLTGVSFLGRSGVTTMSLGLLGAAAVLFGVFLFVEARVRGPLVPLSIFKRRNFGPVNIIGFCHIGAVGGLFILVNLFMQNGLKMSPAATGLGLMPYAAAVMLAGQVSPMFMARLPHRRTILIGFILYGAGIALLGLFANSGGGYFLALAPWVVVGGFGSTLSYMPMMAEATADVPEDQQGVASAILFTIQQIGMPLGATLALSVLTAGGANGFSEGFLATAAVVTLGLVLVLVLLRRSPADTGVVEHPAAPALDIQGVPGAL
jgi:DHA2 family methylenomycin A resistance protein-like MFS transporter